MVLLGSIGSTLLPPLPGVGAAAERLQQERRRAAEFSCDRAALLVTQDAAVVSEALIKLASGSTRPVDVEAYLQQAREYDEALEEVQSLRQDDAGPACLRTPTYYYGCPSGASQSGPVRSLCAVFADPRERSRLSPSRIIIVLLWIIRLLGIRAEEKLRPKLRSPLV